MLFSNIFISLMKYIKNLNNVINSIYFKKYDQIMTFIWIFELINEKIIYLFFDNNNLIKYIEQTLSYIHDKYKL
jgi:hypothetical protein